MEWISWVATVAAATISLLAMGVAIWQGGIASRSATAATIQAEQAKRSADAAADQALYAKQAAEAADKAAAQDHIAEIQQTQRDLITVKNGLYALVDAALEPAAFVHGVQSGTVDVIKSLKFTTLTVNADFDADMHAAVSEAGQLLHDMAQAALGRAMSRPMERTLPGSSERWSPPSHFCREGWKLNSRRAGRKSTANALTPPSPNQHHQFGRLWTADDQALTH